MPGLLSQQRPQQGKRSQPERQPRPRPENGSRPKGQQDGKRKPPPEMQRQYDDFVGQAYNLIYDDKTLPRVMDRLSAGENPVENLATTAVMAVRRVKDSAEQNGVQIDNRVLMNGGAEIVQDLANLAGKAGIHDYDADQIEQASYLALDMYTAQMKRSGKLDEEGLMRDAQMLKQAEQSGQLEQLLPGARKVAGKGEKMQDKQGGGEPQKGAR